MKRFIAAACVIGVVGVVGVIGASQDRFVPASLVGGSVPELPALGVGGGQVFLELSVGTDGRVSKWSTLRATPPFTEFVVNAVRGWQFKPAVEVQPNPEEPEGPPLLKAVASKVLVAAVFRAPTLLVPTLGELPRDIASPSADSAFPRFVSEPQHPPLARDPGVVLIEARLDSAGRIKDLEVIRSAPGYDEVALTTVRQWVFRPARDLGTPVPTYVYILFGFPVPVT